MATKKSRRGGARPGSGPKPLPLSEVRRNRVVLHFTDAELAQVKKAAGKERPAFWIRERLLRSLARRR